MMIFTGADGQDNRGRATVLYHGEHLTGSLLTVRPEWGGFNRMKAIFTRVDIGETGSFQFNHSLDKDIYLYVFGDRIGELTLTGIAFYDNCNGRDPRIGMAHVIDWYRRNRVARQPAPLQVTIDPGTTFETYLLSVRGQVVNPAQRLYQFSLIMAAVPPDDLGEDRDALDEALERMRAMEAGGFNLTPQIRKDVTREGDTVRTITYRE